MAGEVDARAPLAEAGIQLLGRLDRLDRSSDGCEHIIDYKTESENKTRQRLNDPSEDTQLAFYALLVASRLDDGRELKLLRAAYLSLGESGSTLRGQRELPKVRSYELKDLPAQASALRAGIVCDVGRLRNSHPLRALGDGPVCEHCEARGLCRRDFWRGHETS